MTRLELLPSQPDMSHLYLAIAIVAEVIGTTALKATDEFSRLVPSIVVVVSYGLAIYFLTLALRTISVGVAYAIWAGLGIVLVVIAAAVVYQQVPDLPALAGIALIVAGVVIINLYSNAIAH